MDLTPLVPSAAGHRALRAERLSCDRCHLPRSGPGVRRCCFAVGRCERVCGYLGEPGPGDRAWGCSDSVARAGPNNEPDTWHIAQRFESGWGRARTDGHGPRAAPTTCSQREGDKFRRAWSCWSDWLLSRIRKPNLTLDRFRPQPFRLLGIVVYRRSARRLLRSRSWLSCTRLRHSSTLSRLGNGPSAHVNTGMAVGVINTSPQRAPAGAAIIGAPGLGLGAATRRMAWSPGYYAPLTAARPAPAPIHAAPCPSITATGIVSKT
jgi:hypothetical protein